MIKNRVPDGTPETRPRILTNLIRAYGTRSIRLAYPPVELAGYCHRGTKSCPILPSPDSIARPNAGTLVLVPNPVPICVNPEFFPVSHFEICSYIEEAQRFLATTDLN